MLNVYPMKIFIFCTEQNHLDTKTSTKSSILYWILFKCEFKRLCDYVSIRVWMWIHTPYSAAVKYDTCIKFYFAYGWKILLHCRNDFFSYWFSKKKIKLAVGYIYLYLHALFWFTVAEVFLWIVNSVGDLHPHPCANVSNHIGNNRIILQCVTAQTTDKYSWIPKKLLYYYIHFFFIEAAFSICSKCLGLCLGDWLKILSHFWLNLVCLFHVFIQLRWNSPEILCHTGTFQFVLAFLFVRGIRMA